MSRDLYDLDATLAAADELADLHDEQEVLDEVADAIEEQQNREISYVDLFLGMACGGILGVMLTAIVTNIVRVCR